MAACKCKFCGASLTTAVAKMVEINNKRAYFCSEDHHEKYLIQEEEKQKQKAKDRELLDKFYILMCEILGVNGITNTALYKEKKEINQVFSDEVIVAFLEENKDWMKQSVGRLSGGEYGKIRYVSVILRNKLGDYRPKIVVKEEVKVRVKTNMNDMMYEIRDTRKNKRRSLSDMEDMF